MNKKTLTIKDSAISFISAFLLTQLAIVITTCVGLIFCSILNYNSNQMVDFLNHNPWGYLIATVVIDLVLVAVFVFFNSKKENKIIQKTKPFKLLFYVIVALASYFILSPIITCINTLLVKIGFNLSELGYHLSTQNYLISIFSIAIIPAICEELLFRGLILKGLKPYGKSFSILLCTLMFAIFHMSIDQFAYPLMFGLLLSVIMFYENNIIYCIVAHMTNNFIALTISYFKINLVFNHWTYILLAILLACIFVSIMLYFTFRNHKSFKKIKPSKTEALILWTTITIMAIIWFIINIYRYFA